jgi:hypothetical protein
LANVLTSPLDTILQGFLSSFDPTFLAFALLTGYLTFFLFFYGTKKWKSIDWVERFFFGFLFGMFSSMVYVTFLYVPIAFILATIYAESAAISALYGGPIIFLVFLSGLRMYFKVPLCSKEMKERFLETISQKRVNLLLYMLLFTGIFIGGIFLNNPYLSDFISKTWLGFFFYLNFGCFVYFTVMSYFILCLSSLGDLHPLRFFFKTFFWYLGSIGKIIGSSLTNQGEENEQSKIQKIPEKMSYKKPSIKQSLKSLAKTRSFKVLLVALLFSVLLISIDASVSIISPSLKLVDSTNSDDKYIEVYRYNNGSFIYLEKESHAYFIRLPLINLRGFNLSINNPSNFKNAFTEDINSRYISRLETTVFCNDSFAYSIIRNDQGDISSFDVLPLNNSLQTIKNSNITLSYYNIVNLNSIVIKEPVRKQLENGSILLTSTLTITNNQNAQLHFQQLPTIPLYYYDDLGDLTSVTWKIIRDNNIDSINTSNNETINNWLWSPSFNVYPSQVLTINVQAIFGVKTNA